MKSYLKLIGFVLFFSAAFSCEILLFPRRFTLSPRIHFIILNRILLNLYNPLIFIRFLLFRWVLTGPVLAVLTITERVPSEWLELLKFNIFEMLLILVLLGRPRLLLRLQVSKSLLLLGRRWLNFHLFLLVNDIWVLAEGFGVGLTMRRLQSAVRSQGCWVLVVFQGHSEVSVWGAGKVGLWDVRVRVGIVLDNILLLKNWILRSWVPLLCILHRLSLWRCWIRRHRRHQNLLLDSYRRDLSFTQQQILLLIILIYLDFVRDLILRLFSINIELITKSLNGLLSTINDLNFLILAPKLRLINIIF